MKSSLSPLTPPSSTQTDSVFVSRHSLPVSLKGRAPGLDLCSVTCDFSKQLSSQFSVGFPKQPVVFTKQRLLTFPLPFMVLSSLSFSLFSKSAWVRSAKDSLLHLGPSRIVALHLCVDVLANFPFGAFTYNL